MTLYELIKQISEILTPQSERFYEYVLHTSDDNGGFLRTRYCWWEKCVENRNLGEAPYHTVLVTMKSPFCEDDLKIGCHNLTELKMQIDYSDENATFEDAEWDSQLGYSYIYIFDMEKKTYSMKHQRWPDDYNL